MRHKLPSGGWIVTIPVSLMALAYLALFFLPRMHAIREHARNFSSGKLHRPGGPASAGCRAHVNKELTETRDLLQRLAGPLRR